ncbi:MAG: hypothetical protein IJ598_13415 [Ruminococcus sp.]|nr:hypothetical protein [Ruminococcus sp.]
MRFPNAAKGISKIFTAEVLRLITTVTAGLSLIFSIFLAAAVTDEAIVSTGIYGVLLAVFGVATVVLAVISLVLMIIGTIQASRDEASFKVIIYLTIFNIVVSVIAAIFSQNTFLANIASGVSELVSFVCSLLVVLGVGSMAAELGDTPLMAKCGTYFKVVLGIGILGLLTRFFAIFTMSVFARAFVFTFATISVILSIVRYVLYLSLLSNAKKMLN